MDGGYGRQSLVGGQGKGHESSAVESHYPQAGAQQAETTENSAYDWDQSAVTFFVFRYVR